MKTFLFFLIFPFWCAIAYSQQFSLPIIVTDGNGELTLTVGVHPNGSFDFVPGLDQVLPPPPPTGTFDARIRVNNADYQRKFLPNDLSIKNFTIRYVAGSNAGPITLAWDLSELTDFATFRIKDRFNGELYNEDMTTFEGLFIPSEENSVLQDGLVIEITLLNLENAEPPIFNPEPGSYFEEVTVNLETDTETGMILYTLNGSDPIENGLEFTDPLVITETTTIKAVTIAEGFFPSEIVEGIYEVNPIEPGPFSLISPIENFQIEVGPDLEEELIFTWKESQNTNNYSWILYNGASSPDFPLFSRESDSNGESTSFTISLSEIHAIVDGLDLFTNNSVSLIWTARAQRNDYFRYAEKGNIIRFKQVNNTSYQSDELPYQTILYQNYPNPFNPTTNIRFQLETPDFATLSVFDVSGRKIAVLVDEVLPAGIHNFQFSGTNLTSGLYLYKLQTADISIFNKMILIK